MECIIHYPQVTVKNARKFIPVDQARYVKLVQARDARRTLGGSYMHSCQCDAIPDQFTEGLQYHKECYKYFTRAISDLPSSTSATSAQTTDYAAARPKRTKETDSAGRFPSHCMFCKKDEFRIKGGKRECPTRVTSATTAANIFKAATLRCDKELVDEINGVNLLDKDFRKHRSCLNNYCSIVFNEARERDGINKPDEWSLVRKAVTETILQQQRCMSLDSLMDLKGVKVKNCLSRRNMKSWLTRTYKNDIVFLQTESNKGQFVMSKDSLEAVGRGEKITSETFPLSDDVTLQHAANILRQMIEEYTSEAEDLPWPPTVDSLKSRFLQTPTLLLNFFETLLSTSAGSHHVTAESTTRLAESFAQDLIFSITKGSFLTLKHTSVGLGLHNMTGMKVPIIILSQLGHSITYHAARESETAQAEAANEGMSLPIQPKNSSSLVPTIFWWDNFDRFVDNLTGGGSIHNTPGVAFQEETPETVRRSEISINRSHRTSIVCEDAPAPKKRKINPKNPPAIFKEMKTDSPEGPSLHEKFLYLWKCFRMLEENDQTYPRFAGLVILMLQQEDKNATSLTYLPPIERPITDYGTIFEVFYRSEKMAEQSNLKYTHITFDCGAAMKAYHVLFNNPDRFKHIFLHLGDFHTTQAFFGVIGSFVSGSGFEDIVFQLGLCQPGTMNALIKGKHYNQAWLIHESFAESLCRMFIEKYISKDLIEGVSNKGTTVAELVEDLDNKTFLNAYIKAIDIALAGGYGKTAEYWMRYVSLVDILHDFHFAIQSNKFEEKVKCLRKMLPFFFFFDKTHYSRYGTYYLKSLENIEKTHPGAKAELMKIGIAIRRNTIGIGQAVDLAGEQSYMRDAKTAGGITSFQTNRSTVLKWVRSRPYQAKFTESLREMANMTRTSDNQKKCLRPSEILKSDKIVCNISSCIKNQFVSPFDDDYNDDKLYNIVSGSYVSDDIATSLLGIDTIGWKCYDEFNGRLQSSQEKAFFDSIKRNKQHTFKSSEKKVTIVNASKEEVRIERDILGTLLAVGAQEGKAVSIDKALEYPLHQVCPSLSTGDGKRRKTTKSTLFTAVEDMEEVDVDTAQDICKTYMVDLAAYVRSVVKQCKTVRDLAVKLMNSIPPSYQTVYVVCDTYESGSIKTCERDTRGVGERCKLKSPDMKLPYDINKYLSVGENKEELFNLIWQSIVEGNTRQCRIYFCLRDCYQIDQHDECPRPDLYSDHEEADTKLVAYAKLAEDNIMIRSPSGDIDIIVLFVHHFHNSDVNIYIDNGTGAQRKVLDISSCTLPSEQCNALLGVHAFSGNDYLSSFFRKGKKTCWHAMIKKAEYITGFSKLGTDMNIGDDTKQLLEKYLCSLYGRNKMKSVNEVRKSIFWKKYKDDNKIVELCLLPPCYKNFYFFNVTLLNAKACLA